jgi:hypothetical protein
MEVLLLRGLAVEIAGRTEYYVGRKRPTPRSLLAPDTQPAPIIAKSLTDGLVLI